LKLHLQDLLCRLRQEDLKYASGKGFHPSGLGEDDITNLLHGFQKIHLDSYKDSRVCNDKGPIDAQDEALLEQSSESLKRMYSDLLDQLPIPRTKAMSIL
jgi:hypothetical protein